MLFSCKTNKVIIQNNLEIVYLHIDSVFLLFCELSSVFSLSSSKSKVDKNIVVSNGID